MGPQEETRSLPLSAPNGYIVPLPPREESPSCGFFAHMTGGNDMSQITIQNLHFTYDGDHIPVFEGDRKSVV